MQPDRKLKILRRILGDARQKGKEAIFYCPKHPARAGRSQGQLSVNLTTDWFNCWSCAFKGRNLLPLLRLGGKSPELLEYAAELEERKHEAPPERVYDTPTLPEGFRSLSEEHRSPHRRQAMDYLSRRGVGADAILRWRLGYCEDGEYRHRIIFPSFDRYGDLNFVSGRAYYEGPHLMRYKHGNYSKDIVWNDCMVDWSRSVVVTEGPFDAIKAGENAVPLQGTLLNEHSLLFNKIISLGVDPYFAMDSDAFRRQLGIMKKFIEYGAQPRFVDLKGRKDVGEMTTEEFQDRKREAIPIMSELDLIKLRLTA